MDEQPVVAQPYDCDGKPHPRPQVCLQHQPGRCNYHLFIFASYFLLIPSLFSDIICVAISWSGNNSPLIRVIINVMLNSIPCLYLLYLNAVLLQASQIAHLIKDYTHLIMQRQGLKGEAMPQGPTLSSPDDQ